MFTKEAGTLGLVYETLGGGGKLNSFLADNLLGFWLTESLAYWISGSGSLAHRTSGTLGHRFTGSQGGKLISFTDGTFT